ncbi:MAG: hypothetical protein MJ060_04740 [Clostridia bacterium]|nr:hypothetical protein [Clostridia bacterium]
MAVDQIRIVVVNGGGSGGSGVGAQKEKTPAELEREENKKAASKIKAWMHPVNTVKEKVRGKINMTPTQAVAYNMGVNVALQLAKQGFNYFITDIGRRTGDSNYQAQINRTFELVGDGLNIGTGVLSGAAIGRMAGPGGAMVGAILGGISSVASIGFRQEERKRAYQHEMFKQSNNQAYNLARANYSAWTGRAR